MNFNREEAINYVNSLSDVELANLIARNGKFTCTVDTVEEAVNLSDIINNCMIHPTSRELYEEVIKYLLNHNYDFDDVKDMWYSDDVYISVDSDFYSSGMVTIWHGFTLGNFNIITLTK